MTLNCPCSQHLQDVTSDARSSTSVVHSGFFTRKSDGVKIQRFRCRSCGRSFSEATSSHCFGQKKRQVNTSVWRLMVGGFSQRRAAFELGINRKTLVRKFVFLGLHALHLLTTTNLHRNSVSTMEFDDLETFEHTKCKPLSVTLAVESNTRRILGFRVASMPAKGILAAIAMKRYGPRVDGRKCARQSLFAEIKPMLTKDALIKSDQNPHYGPDVEMHFPNSAHQTFKGRRGCVVGQGELKRGGFDPLFSLNHTCAMLRANINRLFRRTWCTTKIAERLSYHIALYAVYHNFLLLKPESE